MVGEALKEYGLTFDAVSSMDTDVIDDLFFPKEGREPNDAYLQPDEDAMLLVSAWADFVLQAISFESVSAMTREDRRSDTTTPYWMAKLFAVLEGIQDDVVLSGRVWIDEL